MSKADCWMCNTELDDDDDDECFDDLCAKHKKMVDEYVALMQTKHGAMSVLARRMILLSEFEKLKAPAGLIQEQKQLVRKAELLVQAHGLKG
jgi:hypothetical protein